MSNQRFRQLPLPGYEDQVSENDAAPEPKQVQPRAEVMAFARAMEEKLRENDHKGGWEKANPFFLCGLLVGELVELLTALGYEPGEIRAFVGDAIAENAQGTSKPDVESVDVANFAMMLYDNLVNGRIPRDTH